jgi:cell division septation protein DedD
MLSILEQEPAKTTPQGEASEFAPETVEFEIVLGRAQIASWLFVVVIAIAVCSSLAYLVGKSAAPRNAVTGAPAATLPPAPAASSTPAALPTATSSAEALPTAPIVVPPKADLASILKNAGKTGPPLFAEPEAGKVYIQMGAVERGIATILAEGLRSHGFDAFVASGPSEKIFRVLIGPLPDPDSFRQAKAAVDAIDLATFARKYETIGAAK